MSDSDTKEVLLAPGKPQVDAMFRRQEAHAIDDSEFLPLLEVVLMAFETTGVEKEMAEELWEYAFAVYDQACKEADPRFTTADNRKLMREHLLGPRGLAVKSGRCVGASRGAPTPLINLFLLTTIGLAAIEEVSCVAEQTDRDLIPSYQIRRFSCGKVRNA